MSSFDYKSLKHATTIAELRDRLEEAIAIMGADARWNGWDDGGLYIHPNDRATRSSEEQLLCGVCIHPEEGDYASSA